MTLHCTFLCLYVTFAVHVLFSVMSDLIFVIYALHAVHHSTPGYPLTQHDCEIKDKSFHSLKKPRMRFSVDGTSDTRWNFLANLPDEHVLDM